MNRFLKYVLYVLTLGILPLYIRHQAKIQADVKRQQLLVSDRVDFDANKLINLFGGKDNITNISNTISTVTLTLKTDNNPNVSLFKKFGIKGHMKNTNQYVLVFGDNAQSIANAIKNI
jgi:phosphotransferase system IIB component